MRGTVQFEILVGLRRAKLGVTRAGDYEGHPEAEILFARITQVSYEGGFRLPAIGWLGYSGQDLAVRLFQAAITSFMMQAAIFLSSGPGNLLALGAIGALAGAYLFYRGFRLLQRKRLILNTPASKIRSASMGLVEISGLAIGPYVVISPLKQMECYYYRSEAWQLKQEGKNREWVKVAEEVLHVPFYVDDNTGRVLVDPRGAEMDLHRDMHEQYHTSVFFGSEGMPGSVAEFLTRHGVNPDKKIKVEEYCIKPKNFLFVLGTLSQNPGLDASIRPSWAERPAQKVNPVALSASAGAIVENVANSAVEGSTSSEIIRLSGYSPVLHVTAMTQQQKIAAALMKAGISNPAAWAAAGVGVKPKAVSPFEPASQPPEPIRPRIATQVVATPAAVTPVVSASPAEPAAMDDGLFLDRSFDLHPPVVLMQGSHNLAFYISWRSQRDVVKSLGWKSALMIWGGPALTVACVYFLLAYFHWL